MTTSATPTSFFSTAPSFFGFFRAMFFSCLLITFYAGSRLFKTQSHLRRDLLKLVFEFFPGQLSTLEPIARLDDFLDVELEDITPAELALGMLPSSQKDSKTPPALLQGELDFLADLVVIGDCFLGLAGK